MCLFKSTLLEKKMTHGLFDNNVKDLAACQASRWVLFRDISINALCFTEF